MLRENELGVGSPRAADWVQVEVVRDRIGFAALREEWSALMEQSRASIFNAWDWLYPWSQRIAPELEPWVLTARDRQGALIGVMPLARQTVRVGTVPMTRLCFLGERNVGSDYLDVVARKGLEEEVTFAFGKALLAQREQWDLLDLLDFDERSQTPARLRQVLGTRFTYRDVERFLCPHEVFEEGETFDTFLKRTRRRDNYLRRRKWLEKQPGYRIEIETNPQKLARPLAEFFQLHAQRWADDGGSSGINGPQVEAFHRDVTHLLAERGKLRLYTLWLGDKALASVYGIVHGDTFHYYQAGYDPEWRNKSVGLVLVGATFEDALHLGLREYDFLRGTETYKSDWVTQQRKTVGLRAYASNGIGAWFVRAEDGARALRELAKRALPQETVEKIRRIRRQHAAP